MIFMENGTIRSNQNCKLYFVTDTKSKLSKCGEVRIDKGTAVIMIIFGLFFMILMDSPLQRSQWNIFLNPYSPPWNINETTWEIITIKNRIILITGSLIFLLYALYNLQKREKFM